MIKLPTKLNISMRVSQFVQAAHLAHVSLRRSIKRGSGWFSHGRKQHFSNLFCLLLLALFILFFISSGLYRGVDVRFIFREHHVTRACSPCVPILHRIPAPVSSPSVTGCLPARSSGPIVLAHLKTGPLHNCAAPGLFPTISAAFPVALEINVAEELHNLPPPLPRRPQTFLPA